MQYSLKEIAIAVLRMYSFTYSQTCTDYKGKEGMTAMEAITQAGFEEDIVSFIDVADLLKRLSWRKRFVFVKRCLDYDNWQIAEILHKSERTIENDFRYAKRILNKIVADEPNRVE